VFDHERLEVYQLARALNREVHGIAPELPPGSAESADNARRAARSIPRNFAESSGRWRVADRVRFLNFARGSGTEVGASMDELVDCGYATEARVAHAKHLAWRIVSMLVALIKSLERDARTEVEARRAAATRTRTRARTRGRPFPDDSSVAESADERPG
jgi:four helix bundle protein